MTSTLAVLARRVRALPWFPGEPDIVALWRRAGRPIVLATAAVLGAIGSTGCAEKPTAPQQPSRITAADRSGATTASPTASVRWNSIALGLVDTYRPKLNQQAALRAMAYLSLAQYNAEVTAEAADANPSPRAAVAGASAVVLTYVFPDAAAFIEGKVREDAGDPGAGHKDFAAGEALGRQVGGRTVVSAKTDGFDAVYTGHIPAGPGFWSSSLVPPVPPLLPLLGQMRPFFLESGSQFRPGPPPEFGSPEFLVALGEVRQLSDSRTDEQLRIGRFWAQATGTLAAGYWNEQAEVLIDRDGLSERDAAHAFAMMNMSAMDANIACHDAKYVYWFIRPTKADPGITLIPQDGDLVAVGLPNHPSYPSNHACISGVASVVLGGIFPSDSDRLFALGREAGISRLYAGLHYRFDVEAGFDIAANVVAVARERDPAAGQPFPMR